jgi:hypothetical protein
MVFGTQRGPINGCWDRLVVRVHCFTTGGADACPTVGYRYFLPRRKPSLSAASSARKAGLFRR